MCCAVYVSSSFRAVFPLQVVLPTGSSSADCTELPQQCAEKSEAVYAGRACSVDEGKRLGQSRRYANKRSAAKAVQEVRERVFASCCPFTFLSCCWPVVWHASPLLRACMFIVRTVVSHVTGRRVYVPQLARIWPDSHASQEPDSTEFLSFSFPFYFEYVLR